MTQPNTDRIKWYRTPIEKPAIKELLKRSDAKGLQQCLLMILLSIATGSLAYYSFHHWPWYATLAAVYFHGMCYFFHGAHAAIHDLSHGTPFQSKGLNAFFYGFFGFISWTSTVRYRASHMQHHQLTTHIRNNLFAANGN
jgi:fatty acid desaturase